MRLKVKIRITLFEFKMLATEQALNSLGTVISSCPTHHSPFLEYVSSVFITEERKNQNSSKVYLKYGKVKFPLKNKSPSKR